MPSVRLEPGAPWSRVKHSTTEPLRSLFDVNGLTEKMGLSTHTMKLIIQPPGKNKTIFPLGAKFVGAELVFLLFRGRVC